MDELPIPLRPVSNGEYLPIAHPQAAAAEEEILRRAEHISKRLGWTRRRVLAPAAA